MSPDRRQPTAQDVAREAGVSRTTVSFVLNDTPGQSIPESTRQAVLAAADRLGYAPSAAARALRSGRSEVVLCLLGSWVASREKDRFLGLMTAHLAEEGFAFVAHSRAYTDRPVDDLWRAITPAAVITLLDLSPDDRAAVERSGAAIVEVSLDPPRSGQVGSALNQADIGRMQVEHLVARGHRRIAYVFPDDPGHEPMAVRRLDGVRAECRKRDLADPFVRALPGGEGAAGNVVSELRRGRWPVTGVCAFSDETAFALLAGMRENGLQAPADLAVIGVDDDPLARYSYPPLTTIRVDMAAEARRLIDAVLVALGRESRTKPPQIEEPILNLVERDST
ncbi:LacI family transcriptional regulator [Saccharopolyspora indica]|uniref:LacI family DNA-binding transcriptional regulator n=1 Tax=Saccharopolyspora indica TaxID=1229659 RepID=UPI0022EB72D4|nr:LacI family DNA-binding transcriptional regulator [Saccharopolyspora indica]MDA3646795.1 LacI family DNA-binding transcriptional regulator [Saccharopolyspora indica]